MFKKQHLALAIAATLAAGAVHAELETSVTLKSEAARFIKDGIRTSEKTSSTDTVGAGKDTYKFENTAKIYLNDEIGEGSSWHGEINIVRDTKAIDDYKGHESYSQKDWLRELYVDTTAGDWDLRLGKQQVVWGTADGIKLLDMVNPTDWYEFNQNAPADARIPVFMVNAEKYLENGGNVQFILSESKQNKFAGLNNKSERDLPFVFKGVDTISGQVNGFYNVAPALSKVAATFNSSAAGGLFGATFSTGLAGFGHYTVDMFASQTQHQGCYSGSTMGYIDFVGAGCGTFNANFATTNNTSGAYLLSAFTEGGTGTSGDPNGNANQTNLLQNDYTDTSTYTRWNPENPQSAFEFMPLATFSTFNSFTASGSSFFSGISTEWKKDYTNMPNLGGRYKNTLDNGLNFSFNYLYHESANPTVDLSWRDSSGNELTVERYAPTSATNGALTGSSLSRAQARTNWDSGLPTTIVITDGTNNYGAFDAINGGAGAGAPTLRFTESAPKVHSIGASFDYAAEGLADNPVILKGEFLYEKGEKQPVIDRFLLAIGDLTNALKMEDADYFKYVLGAETTVATDLLMSGQFIQFRNLDYVDSPDTCTSNVYTTAGNTGAAQNSINCSRYTGDFASMHLTNGLKQARENQNFYSLFLSKPFGDSGEGRWNNIFIYEAGGGKWNRFDVEYGFDDQLIGTFEVNKYFGDENTMFGQFENASNVQIGVKYLLQ